MSRISDAIRHIRHTSYEFRDALTALVQYLMDNKNELMHTACEYKNGMNDRMRVQITGWIRAKFRVRNRTEFSNETDR